MSFLFKNLRLLDPALEGGAAAATKCWSRATLIKEVSAKPIKRGARPR